MRLTNNLVFTDVGDRHMLVPVGEAAEKTNGIMALNDTAAFIANCLKEETTESAIVDAMQKEYDASRAALEAGVASTLRKFRELGFIIE